MHSIPAKPVQMVKLVSIFLENALVEGLKVLFHYYNGERHAEGASSCIRNALDAGGGPGTPQINVLHLPHLLNN